MKIRRPLSMVFFLVVCISLVSMSCQLTGVVNKPASTPAGKPAQQGNWVYDPILANPVNATSDQESISLGDPDNNISIVIPGGSFDQATQVTLQHPQSVPDVVAAEFTPVGAPIEISAEAPVRLNQAATLTFKVDQDQYAEDLKAGNIWITYYDGKTWEYFPPDSTDAATGVVSFNTYHFSMFGAGKIDVEQQIKQYSHSKTLAKTVQKDVDKVVDKIVEQTVDHILKSQLGLTDQAAEESTKFKILSSLANDDEYREIVEKFIAGDAEGFNKTMMVFAGKKIAENVDKAAFKSTLNYLSGKGAAMLEAGSQAAGYIAEGQYAEAGKIIGEKIADSFMVTRFFKAGAEFVQYRIETWKNAEIEAAYQAFRNGADSKFFGYNVDAGDFEALWNQMKGIATRLQSEAVDRETKRRADLGLPPATDAELDEVRSQVKTDLAEQFTNRQSQEAEMEKQAAHLEELINKLKEDGLLEKGMYGYSEANFNTETRLDQLLHLAEKILRDTGRNDWNTTVFTNDKEISANDMVSLMKAWYSTDGPAEYAKVLLDKFGIDLNKSTFKYVLQKPVSKVVSSVTADTETLFQNMFGIEYGLANGGQFHTYVAWGQKVKNGVVGGGFRSSIGAWTGAPDGLNPGDQITFTVNIYPGWDPNNKPPSQTLPEGVISIKLNGVPVGELRGRY